MPLDLLCPLSFNEVGETHACPVPPFVLDHYNTHTSSGRVSKPQLVRSSFSEALLQNSIRESSPLTSMMVENGGRNGFPLRLRVDSLVIKPSS